MIGVGGRGVRGGGPGEAIDNAGMMGSSANCVLEGVGAGEGLEPEGPLIALEAVYPPVPRIGFGPGGRGVEGDGV
jgi:hypothetical protein